MDEMEKMMAGEWYDSNFNIEQERKKPLSAKHLFAGAIGVELE